MLADTTNNINLLDNVGGSTAPRGMWLKGLIIIIIKIIIELRLFLQVIVITGDGAKPNRRFFRGSGSDSDSDKTKQPVLWS